MAIWYDVTHLGKVNSARVGLQTGQKTDERCAGNAEGSRNSGDDYFCTVVSAVLHFHCFFDHTRDSEVKLAD